ncbi:hypothetical protein [Thiocapsa rosea]|uniref:Bacteriophage CI repressor-like protein n=1 Tax=Thiocapsa rosea TaxID=69360 RepID=A0A495V7M4_9GAMM|nr:hypothetical protein [Thiocapsa rosea]RKT44515.1 hypothetical protein BDD21_1900 [Thiocapsa rosea]
MDIEQILDRVAQAADAPTDSAIARAIGLTPGGVRNARRRKTIPYESICLFAEERGLSLDYLLLGKSGQPQTGIDMDIFDEVVTALASGRSSAQKLSGRAFATHAALLYNLIAKSPRGSDPAVRGSFIAFVLARKNVDAHNEAAHNIRKQLSTYEARREAVKKYPGDVLALQKDQQSLEELLSTTLRMARLYEQVGLARADELMTARDPQAATTPLDVALQALESAWGRPLHEFEREIIQIEWSEGIPSDDLSRLEALGG